MTDTAFKKAMRPLGNSWKITPSKVEEKIRTQLKLKYCIVLFIHETVSKGFSEVIKSALICPFNILQSVYYLF